jgi:hypothetical protein
MRPILNNPIPGDLNVWLTVFPGLKAAYDQLLADVAAGKPIVAETYYKLACDKNTTGHHPGIIAVRMAVFIWVQTGQPDTVTFAGAFLNMGDELVQYEPSAEVTLIKAGTEKTPVPQQRKISKTATVIIGTNEHHPVALIYVKEDKLLKWETVDHGLTPKPPEEGLKGGQENSMGLLWVKRSPHRRDEAGNGGGNS